MGCEMAKVTIGGRSYEVEVRGDAVIVDGHEFPVTVRDDGAYRTVNAGGVGYRVQLPAAEERHSGMTIQVDYRPFTVEYEGRLGGGPAARPPRAAAAPKAAAKGGIPAAIAGKVLRIHVKVGDEVKAGQVLLILEAMKMENEVKAGVDGVVKDIPVKEGAKVSEGETLVVIE
jgi:glutaconyl-CoA/methylmalonyl-CoA decarboxylase subunit gamma